MAGGLKAIAMPSGCCMPIPDKFVDNIVRCGRAFGPVFERDEHGCRTGFISSADQIKAIDYKLVGYRRVFRDGCAYRFGGSGGSRQRGSIGQNCCGHHVSLIFRRAQNCRERFRSDISQMPIMPVNTIAPIILCRMVVLTIVI